MAEQQEFRINITVNTTQAEHGLDSVKHHALEANAALELLKKGFEALEFVVSAPIEQFLKLKETTEELINEYDALFNAQAKIGAQLHQYGEGAAAVAEHLEHLAHEIVETSRLTLVQVKSGQAAALASDLQGEALDRVLKVAVNVARFFDLDYRQAVDKVTKATETGTLQIGRFQRAITLTDDTTKRTASVLDALEERYSHFAEGGADGVIALDKAFEHLREVVGQILSESPQVKRFFEGMAAAVHHLTEELIDNKEQFSQAFGAVFVASFTVAKTAAIAFYKVLKDVINGILDFVAFLQTSTLGSILGMEQLTGVTADEFRRTRDEVKDLKAELSVTSGVARRMADMFRPIETIKKDLEAAEAKAHDARDALLGLGDAGDTISQLTLTLDTFTDAIEGAANVFQHFGDKANATPGSSIIPAGLKIGPQLGDYVTMGAKIAESIENVGETAQDSQPHIERLTVEMKAFFESLQPTIRPGAKLEQVRNQIDLLQRELSQKNKKGDPRYGVEPFTPEELRRAYDEATVAILKDAKDVASGWEVAMAQTRLAAEDNAKAIRDIFAATVDGITNLVVALETNSRDAWRGIARDAILEINRIIVQMLVLKAISAIAGSFSAGGSSDFTPGAGAGSGTAGKNAVGAGLEYRAEGGPVLSGRRYIVGERGPEFFVPKESGTVVPQQGWQQPKVTIVNVADRDEVRKQLDSGELDDVVVNIVRRYQSRTVRQRG